MRTLPNLLTACLALLTATSIGGCKANSAVRSSVALTLNGRQIKAAVEGSGAFIHADGDAAIVRFRGHKVRVERTRLIIDNGNPATVSPDATLVEIIVTRTDSITITADGMNLLTVQLKK